MRLSELHWLSKQHGLVWGGLFDNAPGDVQEMLHAGLIERVRTPYRYGKAEFPGGYRITDAGRGALKDHRI